MMFRKKSSFFICTVEISVDTEKLKNEALERIRT